MSNISGFAVLMVLGGSLVAVALYYLRTSIRKLFNGHHFRVNLKYQVTHSRLGEMLTKKDIDLQYYLFSLTDAEIMKHILNCKRCRSLDQCDYYLGKKEMDNNADLPFCPNNDSLIKIKNQQEVYSSRTQDL
jgi:hypothetical protein